MNRFRFLAAMMASFLMFGLVTACSTQSAPTATETAVPTAQPTPTSAPTAPQPTFTPVGQPTEQPTQTALTLVVSEPQDESIVASNLVEVKGQTAPNAIVSVNGVIVNSIDANGNFVASVPLTTGPNLIEVIASDYQNNQVSKTLTVISTQ